MKVTIGTIVLAAAAMLPAAARLQAGAVGGPKVDRYVIGTRASVTYRHLFHAGQPAFVRVSGDGDSNLDIYVYDDRGNLMAKDEDGTDQCLVSFLPDFTTVFKIVVVNRGRANAYSMRTN